MIVLVANLGSTSLKFKLYETSADESLTALASGAADRIGQGGSAWKVSGSEATREGQADFADHQAAIAALLAEMPAVGFGDSSRIDAIGFKAVHGGPISGAVRVDQDVIDTMTSFSDLAPAHNPPYIAAMKAFAQLLPDAWQVAAFETAFHQSIPMARQVYGIPYDWTEQGVRRYGFHGASNAYIARRMQQIRPEAKRVINLHLGGSCSACAIKAGQSVANSFGTTPQTGILHAARVGDFDMYALLKLRGMGLSVDDVLSQLGKQGGLLGISGVSADMRDVQKAASEGNERAQLAVDAFVESCRHYIGAYAVALGGVDALVFTGGIGQHNIRIREAVCRDLAFLGIRLDETTSAGADGNAETLVSRKNSDVEVWVIPTDEEQVVARQTLEVLAGSASAT
ncbi:acetate/propionate family kinase [Mucisphaera calidilacus]|uniref:Acetate kinase n=1 Tax=Mucisphaera calidilacus TaxID=2527982 RepID=A0A518BYG4_9BACT|nr:acetate/propionate family kinase [Mucisphaera calidilacus]QDU72015.1 Acetate kinase [Mucisphaera calidilacus]